MNRETLKELLYQALETEQGGVQVYEAAIRCAVNEDLKEEWEKYREETRNHVRILSGVLGAFGLEEPAAAPGRLIVRAKAQSLVQAMKDAGKAGKPELAELVAAECVTDAETKDHMNWELLSEAVKELRGDERRILQEAVDKVEEEEDEHLYHTTGWTRELWMDALGLPAVLPPPEERKEVETAIGAARAKQERGRMLRRHRGGRAKAHH